MTEAPRTDLDPRQFDDAWDFNDLAGTEAVFRGLLPRLDDPDLALELRTQIARTLSLQRRFDEAHALLDAIEPELAGASDVVRIRHRLERGRTLNSSGAPADAKPLFVEAWSIARRAGADALAIDAAHMVAIVEAPDEAHAWNERGLELARASADPRARKWRGSLTNNMGWTEHGLGRFEQALALFEEALRCREEEGNPELIGVARWCIARALRSLGRIDEALLIQRELLEGKDAGQDDDGYVHEELGECLRALGDDGAAQPHFARAHAVLSKDAWLVDAEPARIERLRRLGAGEAVTDDAP